MLISKGMGVEWDAADGGVRFGVAMSDPYPSEVSGFEGVPLVLCTSDTFFGDPMCQIPIEIERLRERGAAFHAHAERETCSPST